MFRLLNSNDLISPITTETVRVNKLKIELQKMPHLWLDYLVHFTRWNMARIRICSVNWVGSCGSVDVRKAFKRLQGWFSVTVVWIPPGGKWQIRLTKCSKKANKQEGPTAAFTDPHPHISAGFFFFPPKLLFRNVPSIARFKIHLTNYTL